MDIPGTPKEHVHKGVEFIKIAAAKGHSGFLLPDEWLGGIWFNCHSTLLFWT
jgi:hypothetical protein